MRSTSWNGNPARKPSKMSWDEIQTLPVSHSSNTVRSTWPMGFRHFVWAKTLLVPPQMIWCHVQFPLEQWMIMFIFLLHPGKLTWQWKLLISRRYIFIHGGCSIVNIVMLGFGSENDEQISKKVRIDHPPDMKKHLTGCRLDTPLKTNTWNPTKIQ